MAQLVRMLVFVTIGQCEQTITNKNFQVGEKKKSYKNQSYAGKIAGNRGSLPVPLFQIRF